MHARVTNATFAALRGRVVTNPVIVLHRIGDPLFFWGPSIRSNEFPVFHAHTVILDQCDKNLVAYWMWRRMLPHATDIYMHNTHPCAPYMLLHWGRVAGVTVHVSPQYFCYKRDWAVGAPNIVLEEANPVLGAEVALVIADLK